MVVWESGVVVGEALHMHHTYAPIKAVGYDHRDRPPHFDRRAERGEAKFCHILSIIVSIVTVITANFQYQ